MVTSVFCPSCGSHDVTKRGNKHRQRYKCKNCSRYFRVSNQLVKVLLFDIETLPLLVYAWGLYKQNISYKQIAKDWCLLSYSAKWLFDSRIMGSVLTPEEAINRDDSRLARELWGLLDEADVVIAHNGASFDVPRSNARFMLNGLLPPSFYQVIDTKAQADRLGLTSKKLDYMAHALGHDGKISTEMELWVRCDQGDEQALADMLEYNKQDVLSLEDTYVTVRPWLRSHPNLSLYVSTDDEDEMCPICGGSNLSWGGSYVTPASLFRAFRCMDCGSIGRAKSRYGTTTTRPI